VIIIIVSGRAVANTIAASQRRCYVQLGTVLLEYVLHSLYDT